MTIKGIKTAVDTVLNQIKDADNNVPLKDIIPAPQDKFDDFSGFPSVSHFYVNTPESDYATVTQNSRTIEWTVLVYHLNGKGLVDGYDEVYTYMDNIIQKFDETHDLNGACSFLRPVTGSLVSASTERGHMYVGEIRLLCNDDINILPSV